MCEAKNTKPAVDQRAGAGGYDAPVCAGGFEGGEESAGAGDFDGVGAVFLGDAAFDVADVFKQAISICLLPPSLAVC